MDLDLINNSTDSWNVYISLRVIIDFILSPVFEKCNLVYLQGSIKTYLELFRNTFTSHDLTPKHHILHHYPKFIQMYYSLRNI